MFSQRRKRDIKGYGSEKDRSYDESRRRRSKSATRRFRHHKASRSRSRSIEHRRYRHRSSHSRSRSRSRTNYSNRHDRKEYSRHHRDSRSHSRSRSFVRSRSNDRSTRTSSHNYDDQKQKHNYEDREECRESVNNLKNSKKEDSSTYTSSTGSDVHLQNFPSTKREATDAFYNWDTEEPFDKERIHREIEEKLRVTLAKEGKVYPLPKSEASHPVFANDGSFLEIFKKMQEAQQQQRPPTLTTTDTPRLLASSSTTTSAYVAATAIGKSAPPPPIVGRRRGGKILKTGVVAKPKVQMDASADPKDFWSLYLAEVNKYKNNACESDGGTRPLVK